jgi:hypothetical protein
MRLRHALRNLLAFALACSTLTSIAGAQPAPTANVSTVYRLAATSTFVQGCFPPCLCPVVFLGTPRGAFTLTPLPPQPSLGQRYQLSEINWLVSTNLLEFHITGSGIWEIVGGPATNGQRLQLDLSINGEPAEHFDSGWVAASQLFPSLDLTVSINGGVCYDTQLRVVASPVPLNQLRRYTATPGSTFQQGCFPPCLCPLQSPQPLAGSFTLVPLFAATQPSLVPNEYAVVNVRFHIASLAPTPTLSRSAYIGSGFYRHNIPMPTGPVAGQRMALDLRASNTGVEHFNSGVVATSARFPNIDITMSINGMVCFDKVIHLLASPVTLSP